MSSLSRCAIPAKEPLLPVDLRPFMPGITTSETNYFILIHVAESIFATRGLRHNKCKPAQRRDEVGVEVAIVAHKHRGDASTRRQSCSPTAKPRCADINRARASRDEGRDA
jgi:hypothetical protein